MEPLSAQKATDAITSGLELEGFSVHERESAANYAVSVGIEINEIQGLVTCSPARRWKLRYALLWLASRPMVSGKQLERAIGHTTFAFLLCRPLLSIFRNAYDFIRAHYTTPARLWVRAAEECKHAAALILFARSSLRRPFSDVVSAFDASETGVGVWETTWPAGWAAEAAQYDDRWRFKWEYFEPIAPRDNSAYSLGWWDPESVKKSRPLPEGWCLDDAFPEVGLEGLEQERWHDVIHVPGMSESQYSFWRGGPASWPFGGS